MVWTRVPRPGIAAPGKPHAPSGRPVQILAGVECNRFHQATVEDVAREAQVSIATVSRAFNLPGKVSSTTRDRVHAVAQRLGYIPNSSARALRTQRSRVLGVVLPSLVNPVFAECLQGIAQAPDRHIVEVEAVRLAGFQGFDAQLALRDLGQELFDLAHCCVL